jgi:hypothetical protein
MPKKKILTVSCIVGTEVARSEAMAGIDGRYISVERGPMAQIRHRIVTIRIKLDLVIVIKTIFVKTYKDRKDNLKLPAVAKCVN